MDIFRLVDLGSDLFVSMCFTQYTKSLDVHLYTPEGPLLKLIV